MNIVLATVLQAIDTLSIQAIGSHITKVCADRTRPDEKDEAILTRFTEAHKEGGILHTPYYIARFRLR